MLPIPFVGKLRSYTLEREGYDLSMLKEASPEDIASFEGFSYRIAEKIIKYARMVDDDLEDFNVPDILVFDEFLCPDCFAIVSEAEPICHNCGHEFYPVIGDADSLMDELAEVIISLYKDDKNPALWRKGAQILEELGAERKAADFRYKASALELEELETSENEEKVEQKKPKIGLFKKQKPKKREQIVEGIVNGNGVKIDFPSTKKKSLKAFIFVAVVLIPILMTGFLTFASGPPIKIDGQFGDWANIPSHPLVGNFFQDFKMLNYGEYTFCYVRAVSLFNDFSVHSFAMLIDEDGNSNTGFPVNTLGVDYMVFAYGNVNNIEYKILKYEKGVWSPTGRVLFAYSHNQIEFMTKKINENARIVLYYRDTKDHYSSLITLKNNLMVLYQGGGIIKPGIIAERITIWNTNSGYMALKSLNIRNAGNATANVTFEFDDFRETLHISKINTTIRFPKNLMICTPKTATIIYEGGGKKYNTLKPIIYPDTPFSVVDLSNGTYIGAIPKKKSIDGIFEDWYNSKYDGPDQVPSNIDVRKYGDSVDKSIEIYLSVYGSLFGVGMPKVALGGGGNGTGSNQTHNPKLPKDTLEIYVDTDNNARTGYRIGKIGAEYKVMIYGNLEHVRGVNSYEWKNNKWSNTTVSVNYRKNTDSMELSVPLKGKVYYRLVNYEGIWDTLRTMIKAQVDGVANTQYIGTYNSTELKTRFGGDVNITNKNNCGDLEKYNQTVPEVVSNGSALFAVFDAGFMVKETGGTTYHDVFCMAVSYDDGNKWITYRLINVSGRYPVVTADGQGNVFVFFLNFTSGSYFTYFVHYHSNGTNSNGLPIWWRFSMTGWTWWSSVKGLSADSYGTYVYLGLEYNNSHDEDIKAVYTPNSNSFGQSWGGPDTIVHSSYNEILPDIALTHGSTMYVYITYSVEKPSSYGSFSYYEVWYNYTTAGSTSWSKGKMLTASDGTYQLDDDLFSQVASNDKYVYITWEHRYYDTKTGKLNNTDIWFSNITASNGNQQIVKRLSSGNVTWEQWPSIWVTGNKIYIAYLNSTSSGDFVYYIQSNDGGKTWSAPQRIDDYGYVNDTYQPIYIYANSTEVYVIWSSDYPGNADIFFDKEYVPEFSPAIYMIITLAVVVIAGIMRNRRQIYFS